jgi:outer membrane biosynthesis protein TonB
LFGALFLHGMIVAAALFTWQHHLEIIDEAAPVVPVDLVTIAEKTNIAPTVLPQPKIEAKETPPPVDVPVPKPAPAPPKAEVAPAAIKPPQIVPKPAPTPKVVQDVPTPVAKPKPPSDDFNALLNKLTSPAAAPRNAKVADRTTRGIGAMNALTMDLSDALKNQIAQCWNPPVGAPHPEQLIPTFRLFLGPDGSVQQPPQLAADSAAQAAGDPFMRAAVDAARRAIYTCAPYKLPADKYSVWRDITVDFDPRKMFQ